MFYEEVVRHGHDIEKVKDTGCDLYEAHPELKPGVERTTSKNPWNMFCSFELKKYVMIYLKSLKECVFN